MSVDKITTAPAVNLGAEANISGLELVIVAVICGLCLYYLYRTYFGSSGSKCGGCSSKKTCGTSITKKCE